MPKVSTTINNFLIEQTLTAAEKQALQTLLGVYNFTTGGAISVTSISATTSLSSATLATTDNATIGGTLAVTGSTSLAGLTATSLTISGSGNATIGGTLAVTGTSTLTGNTTVGGNLTVTGSATIGGAPVRGSVYKLNGGTVTNNTTSGVNLSDLNFTPVAGAAYEVDMVLLVQSAATTTGVQIKLNTGSCTAVALVDCTNRALTITAVGGTMSYGDAPTANATFAIHIRGILTANNATELGWQVLSEVASSQVQVLANSFIKYTRIS